MHKNVEIYWEEPPLGKYMTLNEVFYLLINCFLFFYLHYICVSRLSRKR